MSRSLISCAALFLAFAAANGCGDSSTSSGTPTLTPSAEPIAIAQAEDIVIGVSAALSGGQAALGQDLADAVDLAIEEFGQDIAGRGVVSLRADDGCNDPEMATDAAQRLASTEGVIGVIGPMCTTGGEAANDLYEEAGILHVTSTATRDSLSAQSGQFFFRTVWRDERQAQVQAEHAANDLDAASAVVIDDGDPYGKTLADAFIPAFEAEGSTVIARERIERGLMSYDTLARQVLTGDPEIVVFQGLDPEGALLLRDLREAGYEGEFMGPDSLFNARDFIGTGGPATDGAVLTAGPVADQAFTDRFQGRFGRVPTTSFVLQAYDATRALLEAMTEVTRAAPASTTLTIDRNQLASAFRARSATGLTGTVAFDERGDRAGMTPREAGLAIYRVANGVFEQVE